MASSKNNTQDLVRLSQWDALLLESLKGYGWSADELLRRVREGDVPEDTSKFKFNYQNLLDTAAADFDTVEAAVRQGYRIKFNTLRGLSNWILLALKAEPEVVAEPGQEAILVTLTAEQHSRLLSVISYGWTVTETGAAESGSHYRIEPMTRL
ncbi:hypothetical protein [Paenibacillus sp. YN15]|uniref:hypothetical protein n=1 Tax=Paenibacillus sp. YN15 TaxID=1742774 RepID=UPI000DCE2B2B|nr:hypothetical protein [Paenibacillus sp. YN15]RAU97918.1 hypothetical protein DQG13_18220 [Paenibacillus sp. YN15]